MKNKRTIILLLVSALIVTVLAIGIISFANSYCISSGLFYKSDSTVYLIDENDSAMIVSDFSKNKSLFDKYKNGDKLYVVHGLIEETYPSRTDGYLALRVIEGDGKYEPEDSVIGVININADNSTEKDHTHTIAESEQSLSETVEGYCGNTQTTIHFENGESYTFMYDESVTMTDILINLEYKKNKICKCLAEYTVDTEYGLGYGVNLSEGYVRCEKGQADLTKAQIEKLSEIIKFAKEKNGR